MKVKLQPHLKLRLKQRRIPQTYPSKIVSQPGSTYFDNVTQHLIAVKELKYGNKLRPMVISYDIIDPEIQVITVYPSSNQQINNRVKSKRWTRHEKN